MIKMGKIKEKSILTFDKVCEIEKILGMDGIRASEGSYLLTHPSGKIVFIGEYEVVFSKNRGKNGKKRKKTTRKCEKIT